MTALVLDAGERRDTEALPDGGLDATAPYDDFEFGALVERHRRSLQRHCYRILKSFDQAEDAVQETLLHAWRARASFAGRAKLGSWLHQIATNVCLDELARRQRRMRPHPIPDRYVPVGDCPEGQPDAVAPCDTEPDAVFLARESLALACLTVVALLPPKQRAVLILRDVLGWSACETAELLDTSVAAVTSSLQRARATLDAAQPSSGEIGPVNSTLTADQRTLLRRYVVAIGRHDVVATAALVRVDVAGVTAAAA